MNGSLYTLSAEAARVALSVFPDEVLDEDGDAQMAGVLYLDPEGVLVGVEPSRGGATIMIKVSTPPRFLYGAMLAFYRVPFAGKVHVVEQDGRWVITEGAGACGLVTKVGVRMAWRDGMRWRSGRELLMPGVTILPDVAAILHRVQRETNGEVLTIMQSHDDGFMVTIMGVDCAIWLPIPEAWRNEDTKGARAFVDSFGPGEPAEWPEDMPGERSTMRKGPIAQARRRTRCANQK